MTFLTTLLCFSNLVYHGTQKDHESGRTFTDKFPDSQSDIDSDVTHVRLNTLDIYSCILKDPMYAPNSRP